MTKVDGCLAKIFGKIWTFSKEFIWFNTPFLKKQGKQGEKMPNIEKGVIKADLVSVVPTDRSRSIPDS
ncbi:MAG: hypothetical protein AB4426_17840 [Xenococcaceae cyanobacterium]